MCFNICSVLYCSTRGPKCTSTPPTISNTINTTHTPTTFQLTTPQYLLPCSSYHGCTNSGLVDCNVHNHWPLLWKHDHCPTLLTLTWDITCRLQAWNGSTRPIFYQCIGQFIACHPCPAFVSVVSSYIPQVQLNCREFHVHSESIWTK